MRRLRALTVKNWEFLLAAGLFLICIYAAVFYALKGYLGAAGYALFCAYGFFQALMGFADAAELRRRLARAQHGATTES